VNTIKEWIEQVHENAVDHGWWIGRDDTKTPELLCLIHSEVSEALEAFRDDDKESFASELADIAIRLFDLCGGFRIDLEAAIEAKHEHNRSRTYRHGNKRC